jgi:predicted AAA+ superfamily ATPase
VDTLVIDEAQLEPGLFRAIKAEVDRDRRPGRFLLTGSARLLSAPDMADALVGRVEIIELWPFSQGERAGFADDFVDLLFTAPRELIHGSDLRRADLVERIATGGFPDVVARAPSRRRPWFDNCLTTATQSVMRELAAIERLAEIPRLLRFCAARTGAELNVSALANEIRKQLTWSAERASLWHFRDRGGAEVDLVLEHPDGRVCGIEVKATSTPRAEDLRGLRYLADRLGNRFQFGVLLTAAPEATPFGPTLAALPVSALWTR